MIVHLLVLTDVYFRVAITNRQTFSPDSIIKFGDVLENMGDGYDVASGKFVAPYGGTYRFTVTVMNDKGGDKAYGQLMVNGTSSCKALAAGEGDQYQTGVCSQVVHLAGEREVWVVNPHWSHYNRYRDGFTTFEGFMIHGSP